MAEEVVNITVLKIRCGLEGGETSWKEGNRETHGAKKISCKVSTPDPGRNSG